MTFSALYSNPDDHRPLAWRDDRLTLSLFSTDQRMAICKNVVSVSGWIHPMSCPVLSSLPLLPVHPPPHAPTSSGVE